MRGGKAKERVQPRQPLSARVPAGVEGEEVKARYERLAADLAVEGYVSQSDWRVVLLLARVEAYHDRLERELEGLPALTVAAPGGRSRPHPLLGEARAVRAQLQSLYGALLMTPRSRSASRLSVEAARHVGVQPPDELDEYLDGRFNGEA